MTIPLLVSHLQNFPHIQNLAYCIVVRRTEVRWNFIYSFFIYIYFTWPELIVYKCVQMCPKCASAHSLCLKFLRGNQKPLPFLEPICWTARNQVQPCLPPEESGRASADIWNLLLLPTWFPVRDQSPPRWSQLQGWPGRHAHASASTFLFEPLSSPRRGGPRGVLLPFWFFFCPLGPAVKWDNP